MATLYVPMISSGDATAFGADDYDYIWTDGVGDCHFAVKIGGGRGLAGHFNSKHGGPSSKMQGDFPLEKGFVLTNFFMPTSSAVGEFTKVSYHKLRTQTLARAVGVSPLVVGNGKNSSFVYEVSSNTVFLCEGLSPEVNPLTDANAGSVVARGRDMTHIGDYNRPVPNHVRQAPDGCSVCVLL